MRRKIKPGPIFLWAPVIAYMALIFYLSSLTNPPLPAEGSDKMWHALGYVGLRLTRTPEAARTNYRIERDDKAAPEARALREAWLKGK